MTIFTNLLNYFYKILEDARVIYENEDLVGPKGRERLNKAHLELIKSYMYSRRQRHKWHIVSYSPWPICTAMSAFITLWGFLCYLHYIDNGFIFMYGLFFFILCLFGWFRDVITESLFMGYHTIPVQENLRFGFVLFIVSEIMFFSSFFWAYFHCSLSPNIHIGCTWPPEGIVHFFISSQLGIDYRIPVEVFGKWIVAYFSFSTIGPDNLPMKVELLNFLKNGYILFNDGADSTDCLVVSPRFKVLNFFSQRTSIYNYFFNLYDHGVLMNPYKIPFLNTVILLTSGCILTTSHMFLRIEAFYQSMWSLCLTVILALYFIFCQYYEYKHAGFSINDGIYGSTFFMLTGFHGFHVIIGTIFLTVCLWRSLYNHYTRTDHLSFECAIWYWHFVDVVWIFLYLVVYLWPSTFFFKLSSISGEHLFFYTTYNVSWNLMNLWIKIVNETFVFLYFFNSGGHNLHLGTQDIPFVNDFVPVLDNPELVKRNFLYMMYATSNIFNLMCLLDWYYIIFRQWWDWTFTHDLWNNNLKLSTSMMFKFDRILPYPTCWTQS
jgi:heme/copper-type cytochrome/quinol oxidase subunit 3